MKKNKILPIVLALATTVSIGISVFAVAYAATADDTKKVQLVTLDYIENNLMQQIDEKIKLGSVESMQESIVAINSTLDYLNTQVATNASGIHGVTEEIPAIRNLITALENRVTELGSQKDLEALREQITNLTQRLESLEGTCAVLTQDVLELKESAGSVSLKLTELENSMKELKDYCQSGILQLSGQITASQETIAAFENTATELKTAVDTVKGELNSYSASYAAMLSRLNTLETQSGTDRAELMQLKMTLVSLEKTISDMSGDYGEIIDAYNEYTKTIAALRAAADGGNASFSAIFLKQGEILTCAGLPSDTMEIIVRRGSVAVTSPIPTQGILDITDSVELLNGKKVTEYHYLMLVGGSDGRGVVSLSGDAWILVRGEYEIG